MQGFALNNIQNAYVGNTQVQSIYLGSALIWPTTPPPHDYSLDYLTFEALEPTSFSFTKNDLQYSLDNGSNWATLTTGNITPQLSTGDKILWKQTGLTPSTTNPSLIPSIGTFSSTGNFKVYGNIMSLYYGDNFIGQTSLPIIVGAFNHLFYNTKIIDASNLILPTTTLTDYCYFYMFSGCTLLITAPELPATTLAPYCYGAMFQDCTSLTTAPTLPVTTLAPYCYTGMFQGCTSLTTAPELPATTLTNWCYYYMFSQCTSLTTAPELPATTLVEGCYQNMFNMCISLNYIKCLATDISANYCLIYWTYNVPSTGIFVKDANTTWPTGVDGIPSGWTIQNA